MKKLFAIALLGIGASLWAGPAAFVHSESIPKEVKRAISENNKIGRDNWDSHSIHHIRAFSVEKLKPSMNLEDVVMAVIRATKKDGTSAFMGHEYALCDQYSISTTRGCARLLLDYHDKFGDHFGKLLTEWATFRSPDREEKKFARAINTIKEFTTDDMGERYFEIEATTDQNVADTITTILINRTLRQVIVVSRNEGA